MAEAEKDGDIGPASHDNEDTSTEQRLRRIRINNQIDSKFQYERYTSSIPKNAWLINMHPGEILNEDKRFISVVDYYFLEDDGNRFKASLPFKPYFYVAATKGFEKGVASFLSKKFSELASSVDIIYKEDLDLPNHLIGLKRAYIKLSFMNINDLTKAKRDLMPKIRRNHERLKAQTDYSELLMKFIANGCQDTEPSKHIADQMENIIDIREYDVPYHIRVSIDSKIFVGHWYTVIGHGDEAPEIILNKDIIDRPDPIILAFDIETTKAPLKFPDAQIDQIMMISYMIDGRGYLIVNRDIVTSDIEDFEYTPKPEYEGQFTIFNETDENAVLQKFFEHVQSVRPHIIVTYNGDSFDWPFVEARAAVYGLDMCREIGFSKDTQGEYKARQCIHMDAFKWVKRDSYLPVGSQGLKACTRAKLRYDPIELDPELMCRMAQEQPQVLASYSVSDAVATYYLYMKYVHPFIFALCMIIPMEPDEVLRKGSGTLCEALLMVEAFHCNIIFPNKQVGELRQMTEDGHLIDSETYVGGHVEALEAGFFRADIPCRFRLSPPAIQQLMDNVERTLQYAIETEGVSMEKVKNFREKCDEVVDALTNLRDCPMRVENPLIYHLDVGAMYPNIILTNRLQPPAIVNEAVCAACDFNRPGAGCQRPMEWMWRAEITPATRSEYERIVRQLENERFPFASGPPRPFHQLPKEEQVKIEKKRLQDYCRKAYKRQHETRTELRVTTVCQRENSFYVDTVRAFRDRRYEYKGLLKVAKKNLDAAVKSADAAEIKSCKSKEVLYDSLQLAHKCILNSFYGYVMRKGSRWHSMEMAGIVCYTGANIITQSKDLVEKIGKPLELDTDGIWCILPASCPENISFSLDDPKRSLVTVSYPGAVLNLQVKDSYTNPQYHTLIDKDRLKYEVHAENSIAFEVDGPYKAILLPAAKEEGKRLKKRYAVFNFDGSIAELKGFEVKRRGELELIKIFQSSVFDAFLKGSTLEEVYQHAAKVADYWLDILFSKGADLPDSELFDLISENRNLSRKLEDYGEQKSTSITTAKRLAEFLGDEMVKDAGLNCQIVIAKKPEGAPVTERAIPMVIFQTEMSVRKHYLRKWLKNSNLPSFDIRDILDWQYYIERLGSAIQKIITIPAALQGVSNPVPRIPYPDWLHRRLVEKMDSFKQKRINEIFAPVDKSKAQGNQSVDIEEIAGPSERNAKRAGEPVVVVHKRKRTLSGHLEAISSKNGKSALEKDAGVSESDLSRDWSSVLGEPPKMGNSKPEQLAWLAFMKRKWSFQKRQKTTLARRSKISEFASVQAASASSTGTSFYQRNTRMARESSWHVIQIVETNQLGLFRLWVVMGNELRQIKLQVPRIFYINLRVPKEQPRTETYKLVNRVLPRCHQMYNLYEYQIEEEVFQEHFNSFQRGISTPEIEGVYETDVPLLFRLIAQVGSVCRVTEERKTDFDAFELNHLQSVTDSDVKYLEDGRLSKIFLYFYTQDALTMCGLFFLNSKKAHVFIVEKTRTNTVPNLMNMYIAERNRRLGKKNEAKLPTEDISFEVISQTNIKDVYKGVQKLCKAYKDEMRGPTMILHQTPYESQKLQTLMPSLDEFPLVKLRVVQKDKLYSTLDWQRVGARHLLNSFLNHNIAFSMCVDLCRYVRVPVGNVPEDPMILGADLAVARQLWSQNFVIWCSTTDRPDFGGKEISDNRLIADVTETKEFSFNKSHLYDTVCIELDVASVPVTALLQANRIKEFEGVSNSIGFEVPPTMSIDEAVGGMSGCQILTCYDEAALCAGAFRALKSVVHSWVKDITLYQNAFADSMIIHFYRWLCSSESFLYDPALKRTVNGYMRKLLLLLIAELKRLGATVVYASLSRLVICTKKNSDSDAEGYVSYILSQLQQKDLFSTLDITVKQSWRALLWLDPANYGGVKSPKNVSNEEEEGSSSQHGENLPFVDMNWNMAHFLPEAAGCQSNFKIVVAGYVLVIYDELRKIEQQGLSCTPAPAAADMSMAGEHSFSTPRTLDDLATFCQNIISGELSEKLFSIVYKIQRKIHVGAGDRGDPSLFPTLPGEHLKMTNPALEFTKAICKVLSLHHVVENQVEKLRRDLLKLIGISEFSDEAQWNDPCLSYVLPEVFCRNCNFCRDIDLCKDPYLKRDGEKVSVWHCPHCGTEYEMEVIESTLIQHVNRFSMSYTLQDLKCLKCKQIKVNHMNFRCECGGQYACLVTKDDVFEKINAYASLASYYNMKSLLDALQWIIVLNPELQQRL